MCGIFLHVFSENAVNIADSLRPSQLRLSSVVWDMEYLRRRGPDCSDSTNLEEAGLDGDFRLRFEAAVLHMRGTMLCSQPRKLENGSVFLWNGEVFGTCSGGQRGSPPDLGSWSDTEWIVTRLEEGGSIEEVMEDIEGPYSFIFYDSVKRKVTFGKDELGRRSLNFSVSDDRKNIFIGSCLVPLDSSDLCLPENVIEVPAESSFYELQLGSAPSLSSKMRAKENLFRNANFWNLDKDSSFVEDEACKRGEGQIEALRHWKVGEFTTLLREAVRKRLATEYTKCAEFLSLGFSEEAHVLKPAPIGLLFSGGLDSTIIAALILEEIIGFKATLLAKLKESAGSSSDYCEAIEKRLELCEPHLHLINVAFAPEAPDRVTALVSFWDLQKKFGRRSNIHLLLVDAWREITFQGIGEGDRPNDGEKATTHSACLPRVMKLMSPQRSHMDMNISLALWLGARGVGSLAKSLEDTPEEARRFMEEKAIAEGLDSTEHNRRIKEQAELEAKDLQHPMKLKAPCEHKIKEKCIFSACKFCCNRGRRLFLEERGEELICRAHRSHAVSRGGSERGDQRKKEGAVSMFDLIYQEFQDGKDEEDLRREGFSIGDGKGEEQGLVKSQCKVLFLGHGADEFLGGYGRHFTKKRVLGEQEQLEEMRRDILRFWERNLGRDDRMISDHGREGRHPFLDESLIRWLGNNPRAILHDFRTAGAGCSQCAFSRDQDPSCVVRMEESKWLLRACARSIGGIDRAANFRKRAIQFGTRLAQLSNISTFGSNRKADGKARVLRSSRD